MVTLKNPPGVPAPLAAYSHVAEVPPQARTLFLAGQVGTRLDGTLPEDTIEQAAQIWANIKGILEGCGMTMTDLVKFTTYVADPHIDMVALRQARAAAMGDHQPASTFIGGVTLANPALKIEIEAIAAKVD